MPDNLQKIVAYPFRAKNKSSLSKKEFLFIISFDARICSPSYAEKILSAAISKKYLSESNNSVSPTFDIWGIDIPWNISINPTSDNDNNKNLNPAQSEKNLISATESSKFLDNKPNNTNFEKDTIPKKSRKNKNGSLEDYF